MIFRRKPRKAGVTLTDVVQKSHDSGYLFVDIMNDLGIASDEIMKSVPSVQMGYGYARRAAAAALYAQGIIDKDGLDQSVSIFKALQAQTGHTTEFQEAAFAESMAFMQTYRPELSSLLVKKIVQIASDYDIPAGEKSDADFLAAVTQTLHSEQTMSQYHAAKAAMREKLLDPDVIHGEMGLTRRFDYSKPNIGMEILRAFSDGPAVAALLTGEGPAGVQPELNELCSHMSAAAIFDDPTGVALSCFSRQGGSFSHFLPVPVEHMSKNCLATLAYVITNMCETGIPRAAQAYIAGNRETLTLMGISGIEPASEILRFVGGGPNLSTYPNL